MNEISNLEFCLVICIWASVLKMNRIAASTSWSFAFCVMLSFPVVFCLMSTNRIMVSVRPKVQFKVLTANHLTNFTASQLKSYTILEICKEISARRIVGCYHLTNFQIHSATTTYIVDRKRSQK